MKTTGMPLSRFTVLDLTRARAGPTAARHLGDWGADVIKIEAAGQGSSGDLGQRHGPDFQNLHRNKRSLTLDLKSPEGLEIATLERETSVSAYGLTVLLEAGLGMNIVRLDGERDRLTLQWLHQQPTRFGLPRPAGGRRDDQPAPAAPGAS